MNQKSYDKVTELKNKMIYIEKIASKGKKLLKLINPPRKEYSFKIKLLISFILFGVLLKLISPLEIYDKIYSFMSLLWLLISIYIGFVKFEDWLNKGISSDEKEKLLSEFSDDWSTFIDYMNDIYSNEFIPHEFLHKNYLNYILKCLKYNRAFTIGEALNLLEDKIQHEEIIDNLNDIKKINKDIEKELIYIKNSVKNANYQLKKINGNIVKHLNRGERNIFDVVEKCSKIKTYL